MDCGIADRAIIDLCITSAAAKLNLAIWQPGNGLHRQHKKGLGELWNEHARVQIKTVEVGNEV